MITRQSKSKNILAKPGWLIVVAVVIVFVWRLLPTRFSLPPTITVPKGGWLVSVENKLSGRNRFQFKYERRSSESELPAIQPGTYRFSGTVTFEEIVDILKAWPSIVYESVTVLEGWSSYDIDAMLVEEGLIEEWAYIKAINDTLRIWGLQEEYDFLGEEGVWKKGLTSLEGFLYPDTYNLDLAKDPIDQLLYLQLETRKKKIRQPYQDKFLGLTASLQQKGYTFSITPYEGLILSSIVQKEERSSKNKPQVMSVFYNRLETWMQIDADISLCYGLKRPYSSCTPQVIVNNLRDKENLRNTRARAGIPPTPIANPDVNSITALFDAQKWPYFFYLHDNSGVLHLWEDLSQHESNKSKYLK